MIHLDSHTNSTIFTDCCDCAISDDENSCPSCGKEINISGEKARWDFVMCKFYGFQAVQKMRAEARKKYAF